MRLRPVRGRTILLPDPSCTCQDCGQKYRCDWMLPDELWEKIRGSFNLLCGGCITERVEFELKTTNSWAAYQCEEL